VIASSVNDVLCGKEDFPGEGGYYLPAPDVKSFVFTDEGGGEHTANFYTYYSQSQFLGKLNPIQKRYIQDTGRLDGWWVKYRKSDSSYYAGPLFIECTVEKFKTAEGARLAVLQYNATILKGSPSWDELGWEYYPDAGITIGDESAVMVNYTSAKSDYNIGYLEIDFSYRNFRVRIRRDDSGPSSEINFDAIDYVAEQMLKKLEGQVLSAPPQTGP
jgi:hypothetical protein